jgi:uncharacterized protein (TIGR02300 family)
VAKPEWGTKRICASCGARFYDLRRNPIICPKCDTEFSVEEPSARRRPRPAPVAATPPAEVKADAVVEDVPANDDDKEDDEIEEELAEIDDESDDDVIEDTSDLGEDDDDMAEVLEHAEPGEKE